MSHDPETGCGIMVILLIIAMLIAWFFVVSFFARVVIH